MQPKQVELTAAILELIRQASTQLPQDVIEAIRRAAATETAVPAKEALHAILENIQLAQENSTPICQDTGTLIFHVSHPFGISTRQVTEQIHAAVVQATERSYLRPNAVDALTGENSGNNLGIGFPTIEYHEWEAEAIQIDVMLKGGGCENVGIQFSLPMTEIQAGRDIEGVKKAVLYGIHKAQGFGCAPGIIGVGIGGDRGTSMLLAKKQLLRKLDDVNPIPLLAQAEAELYEKANRLSIGPMGFGGRTTTLAVKMGAMHRLPASFFVSIAYMCWADRRRRLHYEDGEVTYA